MKQRKESQEEIQFQAWLDEAVEHGLVISYVKQPEPFHLIEKKFVMVEKQMKTKTRMAERHVCACHVYTADFMLVPTAKGYAYLDGVFQKSDILDLQSGIIWVETKGTFMNRGDTGEFSINQKLVYDRHSIWVSKVVPIEHFKKTWCPASLRWMKGRKKPTLTKAGRECRSVEEFMREAMQLHQEPI